MAVCYDTPYPFGFISRSKFPPLEILKFLVTTFIRVDEDGALARSSEFMGTFHNMNIIVKTTGRDASPLNGKIKIPNKTLANIARALLMNSIHNKELWFLPISMTYVSPVEMLIDCVGVFLTSYGIDQDHHTNISKYGVL